MITSPATLLAQLLTAAGLPLVGTSGGPSPSYTLAPDATQEQIAQANAILAALPEVLAAAQARESKYAQAADTGVNVPGVPDPLAATPTDWQYYTGLLGVCEARKLENIKMEAAALLEELIALQSPSSEVLLAKMISLCSILASSDVGLHERPCKIATIGAPHTYPTNQAAIDGILVYASDTQTAWETALTP